MDAVSLHGIDGQQIDLPDVTTLEALIRDSDEEQPFDRTREIKEMSSCGVSVLAGATLLSNLAGNEGTIECFSSLATEFTPFGEASHHSFRAICHILGWRA